MALSRLQIVACEPYEEGRVFGDTGSYERIDAIAHYKIDPANPVNRDIVDLDKAVRDNWGLVRFSGDATFLVPTEPGRGNRAVLLEVPNRGHPGFVGPGSDFLLRRG